MKKNSKTAIKVKSIIVCVLLFGLVVVGALLLRNNDYESDGLKYNKNKSFVKTQEVKGMIFKNIKCTYDGEDSLISYVIVNKTKEKIYLNKYNIIVRDKNKKILTKIRASYDQDIVPGKDVKMANSVVGVDLTDAYYMELELRINEE